METAKPETIDAYVAAFPPEKRAVLKQIRATIRAAAPDAKEAISYRMPTFLQNGVLVHFARRSRTTSGSIHPSRAMRSWWRRWPPTPERRATCDSRSISRSRMT
jgi:uncharacterized protein YdhG (YjbR/CyaY superfamily)